MTQRTPVEVFAPGEFIDEELEARGWSQVELAEVLGRPPRLISELVSGKRAITPETAKGLGAAFGTGPEFWMNLERDYRLSRAMHDDDGVERRAKLYTKAPVKEMCKRGWIEPSENVEVLEKRVHDFFQLSNIDDAPCLAHATSSQWAWLCRIKQLAQAMSVPKYSKRTLIEALGKMEALLAAPEEAGRVPGILAECGVRFVVVEKLPQAEIDGACCWLDKHSPVIGMTMRRDKIDNFWFVLRHEIEHVLRGHGRHAAVIDNLEGGGVGTGSGLPEEERVANSAASEFCAPGTKVAAFMAEKRPFFYERDVLVFARAMNRHPGLIAGQMQLRLNNYAYLSKHCAKIRPFVLPSAIFDGWGQMPSL